ncbi:unnamed protein product, partial [Dracunculus medinensis]|uniref:Transcription factor n=1 Tax=Dracunculus medinensis TaxID=318479 RepID=A0A0N4UNB2_DRAME
SDKKIVAEYANLHGATAAARKFNIPAQVASYYQRKMNSKPPGIFFASFFIHVSSKKLISSFDSCQCFRIYFLKFASIFVNFKQTATNPAHCSGSPGFLRGRGRGRPKLIGDELDAELVDYMVQIKQADPRGHMTASQALAIARSYILDKAPGLLEEHGGQVKLKLTWAMKLVSRITERQKEIELGLPAGALSNMSTGIPPGGNFMADMLSQNFLSQQVSQMMNQAMTGYFKNIL